MEDEINLIDILKVLFRRRKMIVWLFIIAILLGFLQGQMNQGKTYAATVVLLPTSDSGGLFRSLSEIPFLGGGGMGMGANFNLMASLQSRSLAVMLAQKKHLANVLFSDVKEIDRLKSPDMFTDEAAAMFLKGMTMVSNTKDGLLTITVSYKDPKIAADIANAYPQVLGEFMSSKSISANFRVLDYATVPQFGVKQGSFKRMLLLGIFALGLGVFLSFALEYWAKIKDSLKGLDA